jgi:hypothetical protein
MKLARLSKKLRQSKRDEKRLDFECNGISIPMEGEVMDGEREDNSGEIMVSLFSSFPPRDNIILHLNHMSNKFQPNFCSKIIYSQDYYKHLTATSLESLRLTSDSKFVRRKTQIDLRYAAKDNRLDVPTDVKYDFEFKRRSFWLGQDREGSLVQSLPSLPVASPISTPSMSASSSSSSIASSLCPSFVSSRNYAWI